MSDTPETGEWLRARGWANAAWEDGYEQGRADTIAKVVAWLEKRAGPLEYKHPDAHFALISAASDLEIDGILDEVKP